MSDFNGLNHALIDTAVFPFQSLQGGEWIVARLYVAASQAGSGKIEDAKQTITGIIQLDFQSSLRKWASLNRAPYKNPKDLEHFRTNLRMAGLPETA